MSSFTFTPTGIVCNKIGQRSERQRNKNAGFSLQGCACVNSTPKSTAARCDTQTPTRAGEKGMLDSQMHSAGDIFCFEGRGIKITQVLWCVQTRCTLCCKHVVWTDVAVGHTCAGLAS